MVLAAAVVAVAGGLALILSPTGSPVVTVTPEQATSGPSSGAIPDFVADLAADFQVTGLERHGPSGFGWFTGTDATGAAVVAVATSRDVSPFVPLNRIQKYLEAEGLLVETADAGSTMNTVDSREVEGLVAPNVSRVEVVLQGGATRAVPLVEGAFFYAAASPGALPTRVIAYDTAGAIVASKDLPGPSAPGG